MLETERSFLYHSVLGVADTERGPNWHELGRRPFGFTHHLAGNPLFELERLSQLAELAVRRAERAPRFLSRSSIATAKSTPQDILALDSRNDWIKISYADVLDPAYGHLHDTLLAEIESVAGFPFRKQMNWSGLTVFMNSPGLEVPYHFDHETNFLLQVRGVKDVYLYDQTDRSVLTEREIEAFYRGNAMAATYHNDLQHRGTHFVLGPGDGVHHPPLAPHRISNRATTSVSVSVFFSLPDANRCAHIYQVNSFMRQVGLRPRPPGLANRSDRLKIAIMRGISNKNPQSQSQMLFSGMRRLTLPARALKKATSIVRKRFAH